MSAFIRVSRKQDMRGEEEEMGVAGFVYCAVCELVSLMNDSSNPLLVTGTFPMSFVLLFSTAIVSK